MVIRTWFQKQLNLHTDHKVKMSNFEEVINIFTGSKKCFWSSQLDFTSVTTVKGLDFYEPHQVK